MILVYSAVRCTYLLAVATRQTLRHNSYETGVFAIRLRTTEEEAVFTHSPFARDYPAVSNLSLGRYAAALCGSLYPPCIVLEVGRSDIGAEAKNIDVLLQHGPSEK